MAHINNITILRVLLQNDCKCDFCTDLMLKMFDDNLLDTYRKAIKKLKNLKEQGIINNDDCSNDDCKSLFEEH